MENFPIDKLKFTSAMLSGVDGMVSIEIGIEPFELSLDGINLPTGLNELTGRTFTFHVNPNGGYIDGSVYFLVLIALLT